MTLRELCAARGLTLDRLAAAAGAAPTTVAQLAAGTIRAQPVTLRRLGAVLGLEPEALRAALSDARRGLPSSADRSRIVWR